MSVLVQVHDMTQFNGEEMKRGSTQDVSHIAILDTYLGTYIKLSNCYLSPKEFRLCDAHLEYYSIG